MGRQPFGRGWEVGVIAAAVRGLALALSLVLVVSPVAAGFPECDVAVECPGDIDGDNVTGFNDLLLVLAAWGDCENCPEDLDDNDRVDFADLLIVLANWGECPGLGTCLEMAGRQLSAYPHFEFVRVFNVGIPVRLTIDPSNVPAAETADVYIVADRNFEEWSDDPSLVDVRADGPETVTFDGATIQANMIVLDSSFALPGANGTEFGVGYDIVCDFNRNGILDGDDTIDGLVTPGFAMVRRTTTLGPLATEVVTYSGGTWLGQRTVYPEAVESMTDVPLVVISHGNGHLYTWYDYLQRHLASWGYVVMSHTNNTQPGIESASQTTLDNTDYFLANLDTIAGGVMEGRIDSSRITWIGHSRGGEGVSRAYDRLFDGDYVPDHYTVDDIALVSSIAPNDYLGRTRSNPHGVAYHALIGAADGDNGGWPDRESDAPMHVYERATGYRQMTYVHGADHNDFNCCGWNDFRGPAGTEIGRAEAQLVAKASYLALIKHHIDGSWGAKDYLWRPYDTLRPLGVNSETVVVREYVEGPREGAFVIDDFQSQASLAVSSSGGQVAGTVQSRFEGRHDDTDGTFTWSNGDPMNGQVRGRPDDLSKGVVFDWSVGTDLFLEFEVVPAARNFAAYDYLAFRSCQGTRHPETTAQIGDTSFSVSLRDGDGNTSSIDIGAYEAGLQEPYQRTGSGSGAGWQNEYEAVRVRLLDFLHNGRTLDFGDIVAVRFEFGAAHGSSRGRVGLDDLMLSDDIDPTP